MKVVAGYALISQTKGQEFSNGLEESLKNLQEQGMEVEVQYAPVALNNELLLTALLIGRKEVMDND